MQAPSVSFSSAAIREAQRAIPVAPGSKIVVDSWTLEQGSLAGSGAVEELASQPSSNANANEVSSAEVASVDNPETQAPALQPIPDPKSLFSALLVNLLREGGEAGQAIVGHLLDKTKGAVIQEGSEVLRPEALNEKLSTLLQLQEQPEKLAEAISQLDSKFFASLKISCSEQDQGIEQYYGLVASLIQHGPLLSAYVNASDRQRGIIQLLLKGLKTTAKGDNGNQQEYAQKLAGFKLDIAKVLDKYQNTKQLASGYPSAAQAAMMRTAENEFNQEITGLFGQNGEKFVSADIERMASDLKETRKQVVADPGARDSLGKWTKMLFTKEGAIAATMFVPFLSNILVGTLGRLPLIGNLIKPLAGLSNGAAHIAKELVQMICLFNQSENSRAIAEMQGQRTAPPEPNTIPFQQRQPAPDAAISQREAA